MLLRNAVFTLANWTPEHKVALARYAGSTCEYLTYGEEVAPTTGMLHLQGYMELRKRTRMTTVKKEMGIDSIHLEPRRGTQTQAITYCHKDGHVTTYGAPKEQGHRTDLDEVREAAVTGGMREVACTYNYMQMRTAEKYLTYCEPARDEKPCVIWLTGESGVGKSRTAREICVEYGEGDIYTKNDASKWWDGYDRHTSVVIDDFRDSWWPMTEMLRILDRYECRVECKGGSRQFIAKLIVVTSIKDPWMCYMGMKDGAEPREQLLRRIDRVIRLV